MPYKNEFENILKDVADISKLLDYSPIFIGGVAIYLYSVRYDFLLEASHDADFIVNSSDMFDLEDIYGKANPNKRLGKFEFLINNIEYDVYVEGNNNLIFDYKEINEHSVIICDSVRCPAIEHLIALKIEAYMDRKNSEKGQKDKRDLVKLMYFAIEEYKTSKDYLENHAIPIFQNSKFKFEVILNQLKEIQSDQSVFF